MEVTLEAGKALIFDQGIIHEGLPDIQGAPAFRRSGDQAMHKIGGAGGTFGRHAAAEN